MEVNGATLSNSISAYRSVALTEPITIACGIHDSQTTQVITCMPPVTSIEGMCAQWASSRRNTNCMLAASFNRSSQMVTLHNKEIPSVKWNIIYELERDTISLSNSPVTTSFSTKDTVVWESFDLPPHKTISFPFHLFAPKNVKTLPYRTEKVQCLHKCHSLQHWWNANQLSTNPTFLLQSDNSHVHAEQSLLHQLEICHLKAPTVHMYHSDNDYLFVNTSIQSSRCTVQYVSNLTPAPYHNDTYNVTSAVTNVAGTATVSIPASRHERSPFVHSPLGPLTPVCVEDVMYHLMYNTSINNDNNAQSLNFLSSIGYLDSSAGQSGMNGALLERRLLGFRDLVVVLRAYSEAEVTSPLILHSVDTNNGNSNIALNSSLGEATIVAPVALDTKLVKALSRQLLGLMLIFNSDESPEAAFAQALQQLNTTLTAFFSTRYTMAPTDWCPARLALLDLLVLHFGEESSQFVHACRNQLAGTAPVTYLCAHAEARRELGDTVLAHISVKTELKMYSSVVEKSIKTMVSQLVNFSPAITTTAPAIKANPQSVSILVAADVFVFIFVRPEQVPYAQKLVYHWQRHGGDTTNFLFIKYLIFPIYAPSTTTNGKANTLSDVPSLHAVLSVLETKINQLTSVKDVVFVLIGLQAALAFPQPGRLLGPDEDELVAQCKNHHVKRDFTCDSSVVNILSHERHLVESNECNLCSIPAYTTEDPCAFILGTVPSVPYGWSKHLRLPAKITISAKKGTARSTSNNDGNELPWDFTAMVGIGYKLLDMIKAVTTYPDINNNNGEGSNDSITTYTLQQRLHSYAQANPLEVTLDCPQNVFHTTKAAILQQMLVIHSEQRISYKDMPILREVANQPAGNDSIMAVAKALGITFSDDHGQPIATIKPSGTDSYDYKKYYDIGNVYDYRQYRSAMNRLLSAYLSDTNDYYDFKQVISGQIEHAKVVLPLVKLDLLPFPRNYLSKTRIPSDLKHKCYLELDSYKVSNQRIVF